MDRKFICVCIGFMAISSFLSCQQKPVPEMRKVSETETEKSIENQSAGVENFDVFFKRFSKDSVFQKKRTKFPLKIAYYEDVTESEDLTARYVKEKETEPIDFTEDALAMNKETDKFTFKIEKTADGMVYKRIGYDNGIYISYIFSLSGNFWFLSEIIDEST